MACPKNLPDPLNFNRTIPSLGHQIVPGAPVGLVLCGAKVRSAITGRSVTQLAEQLNHLRPVKPGGMVCSLSYGSPYSLFFNYEHHGVLLVVVGASGCGVVSNGFSLAALDQETIAQLNAILQPS